MNNKSLSEKIYADPDIEGGLASMQLFSMRTASASVVNILKEHQMRIVYHNIQGLLSHIGDLKVNNDMVNADFICLTETWLTSNDQYVNLNNYDFRHVCRNEAFNDNNEMFRTIKHMKNGGNKEGAGDHFYQCFIYTGMNRICSLSFSENQKDRIRLDKCYKFRVYPRGADNFRLDGNSKIFYIRECDTGTDSIQMDLALNPEPLSVSTALQQLNGQLISIVGVVHTIITLEDELEKDTCIKVKFWGSNFIPFHSSVSEKVRINLVTIEVYGSIVSCVSSVLSNIQEDDTKMTSNVIVEAVDTDSNCVLLEGGNMYEITKPDMEKIYDFERDEMKTVVNVQIMTEGRKIVQFDHFRHARKSKNGQNEGRGDVKLLNVDEKLKQSKKFSVSDIVLEDHPYFISSSLPTSSTLTKYPPETNKSYHEHDRDDLFHEYIPSDLVPLDHCRFLCELEYLASQLKSCTGCDKPLHLHNASGVRCYGVSGILYIICHRPICGRLNKIKLGKTHYPGENKRGIGVFDVNTKIATEENGNTQTGISVSTDTCWQKKGSGRSYNSLSGVSTLIGTKTGKVVDHRLRISSCKICEKARSKEMIPRKHQCRKNWSESAKGMEPDMVVEMLKGLDDKDIVVSQVVGDDDSTGFDRAKLLMPNSSMVKNQ
ncbi:unnamed protein product [Mytilus coruscus]|uniref:Mutator-like transposase domain-containing protein n=1 Tax=Mytilus coruscus TaxID=42192 RepID=A0A6J8CB03_MYTCO|nr:unnamed protein product [Mytilus coruscus]